jgi:hypothetical protein
MVEAREETTTLTCGKTSVGKSSDRFVANRKRVNECVLAASGALSELSIYLTPTSKSGQQLIKGVVYASVEGSPEVPSAILGTTNELTFTSSSAAGWYHLTFPAPLQLAAGEYWIGVISGASKHVAGYRYDNVENARDYNANTYTSGPSDPFGLVRRDDEQMSLYATYTVTGPPQFGKASVGESSDRAGAERKRVNRYALPIAGSVSKLSVYLAPTATEGQQALRGVIYADASGAPHALLAVSEQLTFTSSNSAGWYDLAFSSPVKLAAGNYWIGFLTGATSHVIGFRYDNVENARDYNNDAFGSGPGDPFGSVTTDDEQMSLYATYTPG